MKEIILKEIEKLRVASNNGEIEGDEFLDKFFSLREILKKQLPNKEKVRIFRYNNN